MRLSTNPVLRGDGAPSRDRRRRAVVAWFLSLSLLMVAGCAQQTLSERPAAPQAGATETLPPYGSGQPAMPPVERAGDPTLPPVQVIEPAPEKSLRRVVLLVPLSGPHATLGQGLLNAAQLALFDVAGEQFELLPRDTGSTTQGAAAAAAAALDEGVGLILGPVFADSVRAVAAEVAVRRSPVPVVAFSNDRTVAGEGVYVLGALPEQEVERMVNYAVRNGLRRIGALAPDSAYGAHVVSALERSAAAQGAMVTRITFVPERADGSELADAVQRFASNVDRKQALDRQREVLRASGDPEAQRLLKSLETAETYGDLPYDAVFLPAQGRLLRSMAPLLPFYDVDPGQVRFFGTSLWHSAGASAEPALIGGVYPFSDPTTRDVFERRYRDAYRTAPPALASLAYDAAALAAILAAGPGDAPFTREAIEASNGFAGADGLFRFRPDGATQRGFAILQVRRDGPATIEPAPDRFEPMQF